MLIFLKFHRSVQSKILKAVFVRGKSFLKILYSRDVPKAETFSAKGEMLVMKSSSSHYKIHPVNIKLKIIFILHLLDQLAKHQVFISLELFQGAKQQGYGSDSGSAWIRIHFPSWIRIQIQVVKVFKEQQK